MYIYMSTTVVVCGLVVAHIGTCLCYQSVNPRKATFMIGYDTTRDASTPQHTEAEGIKCSPCAAAVAAAAEVVG